MRLIAYSDDKYIHDLVRISLDIQDKRVCNLRWWEKNDDYLDADDYLLVGRIKGTTYTRYQVNYETWQRGLASRPV